MLATVIGRRVSLRPACTRPTGIVASCIRARAVIWSSSSPRCAMASARPPSRAQSVRIWAMQSVLPRPVAITTAGRVIPSFQAL